MMTRTRLTMLTVALVMATLSTTGCGQKEIKALKVEVASLKNSNAILQQQRNDAQQQLADSQTRSTGFSGQLDDKDLEIESLRADRAKAISKYDALKKKIDSDSNNTGEWKGGRVGAEISIGSDVLFRSGRATLTTAGKRALSSVASGIVNNHSGKYIRVYGHTDGDPIRKTKNLWSDNLDLSSNRAMAVTRYLISKGINGSLIESIGMGSTRPIAGNKTAAAKKKNRRVEIMIIK
ncbi:MAG: OmpA family protein [bacterium]|nr:OmpA family protein [bacterium]